VYRKKVGCGLLEESDDGAASASQAGDRDYDVAHYARLLRRTFASRLACAFAPADYEAVLADPGQMSLFMPAIATIRTILRENSEAQAGASDSA